MTEAGDAGNETLPPTRRVGRPRLSAAPSSGLEPREEILRVAAALFVTQGYAATSTRLIAERVGVRQASLFHHFAHKEDILAELLDRTIRPALTFSEWLALQEASTETELFALVSWDVLNLCSRHDILAGLQLLHEARDPRFATFWADRDRLKSAYHARVEKLASEGQGKLKTELVFGLVESVLWWYEREGEFEAESVALSIGRAALQIVGTGRGAVSQAERRAIALHRRYHPEELSATLTQLPTR